MEITANIAAVVTGGASGLGEATARALAAKGAKVAIFDLQEEKGLAGRRGNRRHLLRGQRDQRRERRCGLCQGTRGAWPGTHPRQLRRRRQRDEDRQPIEGRRHDPAFPAEAFDWVDPDQPGRQLPLHRLNRPQACCRRSAPRRSQGGEARRHRQHRQRRGRGWPDRSGRLFGIEGRRRRHDAADRARPDERRRFASTRSCQAFSKPRCCAVCRNPRRTRSPPRCRSPSVSAAQTNTPILRWR